MHDEQSTQSVKDILEDIKKAIFGNNTNDSKAVASDHGKGNDHKEKDHLKDEDLQQTIADDDDILNLKEEYLQNEDIDEPDNYLHSDNKLNKVGL